MDEFELIDRYFSGRGARRGDVPLGIGDDAAVLAPPAGRELLLTTDTLVAGRHFPADGFPPDAIGHRALAVNLSDIAAMGGTPAWALLAIVLPQADEAWLASFAEGFSALAERFDVALVGGNVARGPLSITVTAAGFAPQGQALTRRGAQAGDALVVTGALGGGAAGLRAFFQGAAVQAAPVRAYAHPEPRVQAGRSLLSRAHAAIDISDGLLGDLGKLLYAAEGLGAELEAQALPLAPGASREDALGPSDDYELLAAVPEREMPAVEASLEGPLFTRIGRVTPTSGIRLDGRPLAGAGFRHFA
ncbi:MAG: thiamine-phosphate kinase [Gammaproteobacteria bacterium]|nr:thiamine-phosphate kinase [Gammaproteobacteria bacterium]